MTSDPEDEWFYTAPGGVTDCSGRVCYAFEGYSFTTQASDIDPLELLRFDISSSKNPASVRAAGKLAVAT